MKIFLIVFLAIILGIGVGAGIYFTKKKINDLQKQLDEKTAECANANANKNTNSSIKTFTPCVSTLSAADKQEIETWSTYQNKKYSFSFRYPESWQITKQENVQITLHDDETDLNLNFYSGWAPEAEADNYLPPKEDTVSTKVACVSTTRQTLFDSNNYQKLYTKFTKNENNFAIIMTFRIEGASISGDLIDAYDLILKTVEFK